MNEPLSLHITVNANDPELDCMNALRQVMIFYDHFSEDELCRIADWFYDRYRVKVEV